MTTAGTTRGSTSEVWDKGGVGILGSKLQEDMEFTQVQPLRRVIGLLPACVYGSGDYKGVSEAAEATPSYSGRVDELAGGGMFVCICPLGSARRGLYSHPPPTRPTGRPLYYLLGHGESVAVSGEPIRSGLGPVSSTTKRLSFVGIPQSVFPISSPRGRQGFVEGFDPVSRRRRLQDEVGGESLTDS